MEGGTRVVHRRPVNKVTLSAKVFAKAFLGGLERHVDDLEGDLRVTLDRFKTAAEG